MTSSSTNKKSKNQSSTEKPEESFFKTLTRWIICIVGIYTCFMLNSYLKELM